MSVVMWAGGGVTLRRNVNVDADLLWLCYPYWVDFETPKARVDIYQLASEPFCVHMLKELKPAHASCLPDCIFLRRSKGLHQ